MATAIYLEHYLDSIDNLPCELRRNFSVMRELDSRAEEMKGEINRLAAEYITSVRNLGSEQRVERLQRLQSTYSKCREYSSEKVQLAMKTYELVDKHICRLDADLARFEMELKETLALKSCESLSGGVLKKDIRNIKEKKRAKMRGRRALEEDSPKKRKLKHRPEVKDAAEAAHSSDVLDMPVDPNEPTYCLCHQVSYGEMIGCDNPDCPIEWFHFRCVNLSTKPSGKWFCPRCVEKKKKN
ncbi:hypothetical protein GJAV_G00083550 [Gymnothorax javanicus]|nr:hypothetical protein GJAV_G00083550 [Gymnothorax javanicus]